MTSEELRDVVAVRAQLDGSAGGEVAGVEGEDHLLPPELRQRVVAAQRPRDTGDDNSSREITRAVGYNDDGEYGNHPVVYR